MHRVRTVNTVHHHFIDLGRDVFAVSIWTERIITATNNPFNVNMATSVLF